MKYSLESYQIDPQSIACEISEYLIAENPRLAMSILPQLKRLGVRLQIDNFGRAASVYGRVQPNLLYREFERVKIDRYLTNSIDKQPQTWEVFQNIVMDVENYGLEITGTGIENLSQLNKVKEIACDYGQGCLLSKPISAKEVELLMSGKSQAIFNKSNLN